MHTQIIVSLPFASIQFHCAASLLPLLAVFLQPMGQDNAFTIIINKNFKVQFSLMIPQIQKLKTSTTYVCVNSMTDHDAC